MYSMFAAAESFNQDVGGWDVSSVTNMDVMFYHATVFDQDLSGWCVSNFSASNPPSSFASGTAMLANGHNNYLPQWGTCPAN